MAVQILLSLAILIISAKVFGEIAERLKIAPLAGELFGGIAVGALHLVSPDATLQEIANLGILFLFFIIGLNMKFEKSELYASSLLALAGATLSFAFGFLLAYYAFSNIAIALVVGAVLLSTSTPTAMGALQHIGEYKTKVHKIASSAELTDGFMAIVAISLLSLFFAGNAEMIRIAVLFFALAALLIAMLTIGSRIANSLLSLFRFVKDEQIFVAIPLVIVFLIAFISEKVGLIGIAGAFLAGIAMSRSQLTEATIMPKIKTIGHGFFIPLFFAYAALSFDVASFPSTLWLFALLFAAGLIGKLLGYGLLSSFLGLKGRERKVLGLAMLPRGEYAIIIAQLALGLAVISAAIYTALLSFILISVILTPILLRLFGK